MRRRALPIAVETALTLVTLLSLPSATLDAQSPRPRPLPTATASPAPTPSVAVPSEPDASAPRRVADIHENPKLVAALEVQPENLESSDRIALFDNGVVAHVARERDRRELARKTISLREVEIIRKDCEEAAKVRDASQPSGLAGSARLQRMRLEIAGPAGDSLFFAFDQFSQLPLAIGRVVGRLEELKSRFREQGPDTLWDPAVLAIGQVLTRRSDGHRFRIVQDDSLGLNVELEPVNQSEARILIPRASIPRLFEAPSPSGNARR